MIFWFWFGFVGFILSMLALDLGLLNRKAHVIGSREALGWASLWATVALAFSVFVYFSYEHHWLGIGLGSEETLTGGHAALQYLTGWVIEYSLSLDNIFIIAVIFSYFGVVREHQHRVLFWGILGALILRGVMIGAGAALIHAFDWVIYVFGILLLFTAARMLKVGEEEVDPEKNPLVKLARKIYPVTPFFEGERFFTRYQGQRAITPLFLVLLVVESTDVLFAVDSIPAIFAVTRDPFLVFTSNVFAILGLRSLYFALAGLMAQFKYLRFSLVFLLAFIGIKMLLSHYFPIPTLVSLAIVVGLLGAGVLASLIGGHREKEAFETGAGF